MEHCFFQRLRTIKQVTNTKFGKIGFKRANFSRFYYTSNFSNAHRFSKLEFDYSFSF